MLDAAIVLLFVAISIAAGFASRAKASRNLAEYLLAGRSARGWVAGLSMAATQFAADTPLLVCGLIATAGVGGLWRLWIYGLAFLLMGFVIARTWRRSGVLTDAELTAVRYSGPAVPVLRTVKAVYYGTIFNSAVMAMVLVAAVRICEVFLPWHQWLGPGPLAPLAWVVQASGLSLASGLVPGDPLLIGAGNLLSILLMLGFTTLYSATGGLRSVMFTDVFQLAIALGGTAIYAAVVWSRGGGGEGLAAQVAAVHGAAAAERALAFSPPLGEALWPFLAVVGLQWLFQMNSDGTGYLAQRSMACASDREAVRAGAVFAWTQVVLRSLLWLVIGVGLLVVYPQPGLGLAGTAAAREMTFVQGIADLLPAGARGLMLTAMLAALASTIDTHLNWGAGYWANDLYGDLWCRRLRRREPDDRHLVWVARGSTLLLVVLALVVMGFLGSIQTAWTLTLLFGAGMGGVLLMRWLWERTTAWSEIAAMAASLALAPVLLLADAPEWARLAVMGLGSAAAALAAALLGPATDPQVLAAFYRRVHPVGWWAGAAAACGQQPVLPLRRLGRQAGRAAGCAASLFLVLYGAGKPLVHLPGEALWPAWCALAIGLGLVPWWLRRLDDPEPDAAAPR